MKQYNLYNLIAGWAVFAISAVVFLLTIEPTASFWDCGEFITTATNLQVGHPPGAPVFMIFGRFFTILGGSPHYAGLMVNIMSALASAFTILFLFWTITHLARKLYTRNGEMDRTQLIAILGSGLVGSLAYAFSDTFWFSAVEGEVYATSSFLTALVFWAILKWENVADEPHANRWLIFIAYLIGLSIGVHLLNLLAIPAIVFVYYFRKYKVTNKGVFNALVVSLVILGGIGLPYHSGSLFYLVALTAGLIWAIRYTLLKNKVFWNTVVVAITVILIGYSSFALIIIRSSAGTPMDQNSPNDTFSLLSYLNREQYGQRPLVYGQYYNSPLNPQKRYLEGNPIYSQRDGKYVVTDHRVVPNYDPKFQTLFPRMWSSQDPGHAAEYESWGRVKGNRIQHINESGEKETIVKPTMIENLRFFFRYQVGHMYLRYFMWNFAGRQDDIQSHGGLLHGNWISGIGFLDNYRLGNQDDRPESLDNRANNKYFFFPFLLGLLGIFYLYNLGKEGKRELWLIFLLFVMTGLAIVVYLNQYPIQPRERDYAFAGSFYAWTIWIGLGVLALTDALKKILPGRLNPALVTLVTLILVPGIMLVENYDDHDRSNRYTARDLGANYLKTCADQAVIFTNGDNDTFPLWYNQDVEGVRTDVRVCNLSYLQTDWYITQMKRKAWDSEPLPFSLKEEQYTQGTRDIIYLLDDPRIKRESIDLLEAVNFVNDDNPATKLAQAGNAAYFPKKKITFKVDKEAVIRNKVVPPEDYDKIVDTMYIDLSDRDYLAKDEYMIFDLLAHNNWERPIYFAITIGPSKFLNLRDYFQLEGFAYRLVPIKVASDASERINFGKVSTGIMYDNLFNKYKWGNMNDPSVYIDENNSRMMTNIRNNFNRLGSALVQEGKMDSAKTVILRGFELVPTSVVPFEYFSLEMLQTLYQTGAREEADNLAEGAFKTFNDMLAYMMSLPAHFQVSGEINEEIQRNIFYLQRLERTCTNFKNEEMATRIAGAINEYIRRYQDQ